MSNNVDGTNADRESDESRSDERVDTHSVPSSVPRSMPSIAQRSPRKGESVPHEPVNRVA